MSSNERAVQYFRSLMLAKAFQLTPSSVLANPRPATITAPLTTVQVEIYLYISAIPVAEMYAIRCNRESPVRNFSVVMYELGKYIFNTSLRPSKPTPIAPICSPVETEFGT